jgi:hypothetical protein
MEIKNIILIFMIILSFTVSCDDAESNSGWDTMFEDIFESDTLNWTVFEQIINAQYEDGIGSIQYTNESAYEGAGSLCVWANSAGSDFSNHLLAQYRYSYSGYSGVWKFELAFYIPSGADNNGQVGPEFSMQNTRETSPGTFKTTTAGIQYISNTTMPEFGTFSIWHNAGWVTFYTETVLEEDKWYKASIKADYNNNKYVDFQLNYDNITISVDLSEYIIGEEIIPGNLDEGFWLTCESENIWGEPKSEYRVLYDNVKLERWN